MDIPSDWLITPVEDAPTSFDPSLPQSAGLRARMAWQKLKSRARPGDELWAFENPSSTWRKLGRRRGFALVRDGVVVESVTTSRD